MFKKVRTTILKAILKEFYDVSIVEFEGEVHIMITEPYNNEKVEKQIHIEIFEYVNYETEDI